MTESDRTQEQRVRRMAERQGLKLKKSARRDPLAIGYGKFWVVNPRDRRDERDPDWSFEGRPADRFPSQGTGLDEAEQFLRTRPEDR